MIGKNVQGIGNNSWKMQSIQEQLVEGLMKILQGLAAYVIITDSIKNPP